MAWSAVGHVRIRTCVRAVWLALLGLAASQFELAYAQTPAYSQTTGTTEIEKSAAGDGPLRFFKTMPETADAEHGQPQGPGLWHERTAVDVEPSSEGWIGFEAYRRVASLYSGTTIAPFGNLRQDGLRVRFLGGGSMYRYAGRRFDTVTEKARTVEFSGLGQFGEILAGWQVSLGNTTVKAFAGWATTVHLIAPFDEVTKVQGKAQGAKAVLEIWHNWTPRMWTSLDLAAAQTHRSYLAQMRAGWRVGDAWSIGPEASLIGHAEAALQRAGAFVRYESLADEFTISGGVMRARGDLPTAYGTAQYLRRF